MTVPVAAEGLTVAVSVTLSAKCDGLGLEDSAVVVATHDVRLAPFASRRIKIEDGRILADGPTPLSQEQT